MVKVLLVYENVPETTDVYLLDVEPEDLKWMSKCHRRFINTGMSKADQKACDQLSMYLDGKQKVDDKGPLPIVGFDVFILSGFLM